MQQRHDIEIIRRDTDALIEWCRSTLASSTPFAAAREIARRLGAWYDRNTGHTTIGFWAPDLVSQGDRARTLQLEVFTPLDQIDFEARRQTTRFRRVRLPLPVSGEFGWAVLRGLRAGGRDRAGCFYRFLGRDADGRERTLPDPVAWSVPFGPFAPCELYDVAGLQAGRRDLEHFGRGRTDEDGFVRVDPPATILQLHVSTATAAGTLSGLADVYARLASKIRDGDPLTPAETVFTEYEAVQPLPVDPTIELREGPGFFIVTDVVDEVDGIVGVTLKKPDTTNWGYDNVVATSSAVSPAILGSGRPDELVQLAEELHLFPGGPISLVFDLVYGHADNQALELLNRRFFKGPNMYGQDLNHQDPMVRAMLLEMQRRKTNFGCDGLRIDGAQDFRVFNPKTGQTEYDDDYLEEMSEVPQEIGMARRKVWMIFEDGRPWPAEGWETSSTYRDVIERQPEVFQWGPLIFAHNTPMLNGFWHRKWWRVEEVAQVGGHWISGCGNHDTLRRGTQVDPSRGINRRLGRTLPEIMDRAYDNGAVLLLAHGLLPGIPMDFLNAVTRTPWGFFRNTDDRYGVKVVAEERGFFDWQLEPADFHRDGVLRRTKRWGFDDLAALRSFLADLAAAVEATGYELAEIAAALREHVSGLDARALTLLGRDVMDDVHELCNVGSGPASPDPDLVALGARLRRLRRRQRWLMDSFRDGDWIRDLTDDDRTVFVGSRRAPSGDGEVALIATMEGAPFDADPEALELGGGWNAAIAAPGAEKKAGGWRLPDATGVLLLRGAVADDEKIAASTSSGA